MDAVVIVCISRVRVRCMSSYFELVIFVMIASVLGHISSYAHFQTKRLGGGHNSNLAIAVVEVWP